MKSELKMLVLGSRGSKLALWQAEHVRAALQQAHPGLRAEIRVIKTKGDKILDVGLAKIGDKGLFTREIEEALLAGEVDLAVHSLKDLPTELPEGTMLGAVLTREDPADAFISSQGVGLIDLPANAVIGTSSLRRIAQLMAIRPDIKCYELRGNVDTRLRKMRENGLDGIILAYAGLKRLGLESVITEKIDSRLLLPAVGQGAIGIEIREDDQETSRLLEAIAHRDTWDEVLAERAFLRCLGGGCQVPIGARAICKGDEIVMSGLVASLDGSMIIRGNIAGLRREPEALGEALGEELLERGAKAIISALH